MAVSRTPSSRRHRNSSRMASPTSTRRSRPASHNFSRQLALALSPDSSHRCDIVIPASTVASPPASTRLSQLRHSHASTAAGSHRDSRSTALGPPCPHPLIASSRQGRAPHRPALTTTSQQRLSPHATSQQPLLGSTRTRLPRTATTDVPAGSALHTLGSRHSVPAALTVSTHRIYDPPALVSLPATHRGTLFTPSVYHVASGSPTLPRHHDRRRETVATTMTVSSTGQISHSWPPLSRSIPTSCCFSHLATPPTPQRSCIHPPQYDHHAHHDIHGTPKPDRQHTPPHIHPRRQARTIVPQSRPGSCTSRDTYDELPIRLSGRASSRETRHQPRPLGV